MDCYLNSKTCADKKKDICTENLCYPGALVSEGAHHSELPVTQIIVPKTFVIRIMIHLYGRVSYRILGWGEEGGIKCVRKHVTRALMTFWKFLSRRIIELHFNLNLHTTVSINTVNLFIHCTISIV